MIRTVLFFTVTLMLFTSGCANNKNLGSIKLNYAVTNAYKAYELNPDYNYFYNGIFLEPTTILGIDKSYTVQGKFWTPIDLTEEQLKTWVTTLEHLRGVKYANTYMGHYQGSDILNPQGTIIGNWYSRLDWGLFDFTGDNTVVVYPPSLKAGSGGVGFRRFD